MHKAAAVVPHHVDLVRSIASADVPRNAEGGSDLSNPDRMPRNWRPLNHLVALNEVLGQKNRVFLIARPTHVPTPEALERELAFLLQGLCYSAVFLVTQNIFISVGVHLLWNKPARLLPVPFSPGVEIVWYAVVLIFVVVWTLVRRFSTHRRALVAENKATHAPA